jgi:hypothetical protein
MEVATTPIHTEVEIPRGQYVHDDHKYTSREKIRLLILKPGVQFAIVVCALVDLFMLIGQVHPLLIWHSSSGSLLPCLACLQSECFVLGNGFILGFVLRGTLGRTVLA